MSQDPCLFENAIEGSSEFEAITTRELQMIRIMEAITDKPGWEMKVFDDNIVNKWRAELAAMGNPPTKKMVDWIMEELRFKANMYNEIDMVYVYDGDIVKSDTMVPKSLQASLKAAVAPLENVPDEDKDYHPGTNNQVLDLVHPSLFPLVYGKTRVIADGCLTIQDGIKRAGEGEIVEWAGPYPEDSEPSFFSQTFQWLPCDVAFVPVKRKADTDPQQGGDFVPNGVRCKVSSYINNLHPDDHGNLYSIIEELIALSVPLWNLTLSGLKAEIRSKRIEYDTVTYDPDPDTMPNSMKPPRMKGEHETEYWDRLYRWENEIRKLVLPEPGEFMPRPVISKYHFLADYKGKPNMVPEEHIVDLYADYKESGIQVIVKLANIHLTPENPTYPGGSWHVEGQLNERICATALYYYDSENITESRLAFRRQINDEWDQNISYPQEHRSWLEEVFGLRDGGPMVQEVGSVVCKEGRLLTFPNTFQHKVMPFSLQDATKPGHRKIVALFLVDPNLRIRSTADVPAQRRDWWERVLSMDDILVGLPQELKDQVEDELEGFMMSMDEAKQLRLKLMEERSKFVTHHTVSIEAFEFSLCEH
ncbi:hypothetical protein LOZ66_003721 [Ophidiomyces ophidiicola]|nr:hypothetical protein LOZ66_003721 [Ophidiomyces ophidiicola]